MGLGRAGRNDANDFFVVPLVERVHNQQDRTRSDSADRDPAFLGVIREVTLRDRVRVVENQNGGFKANVVLAEVLPALVFVPFKSHGSRSAPFPEGRSNA